MQFLFYFFCFFFSEELIGKQRRMEVANIRYEGKLKRLAIEEQMKMQQRIEEQAERQRRLAIKEQMKIKQIEEEEMAKKLKLEAAAVSKKSNNINFTNLCILSSKIQLCNIQNHFISLCFFLCFCRKKINYNLNKNHQKAEDHPGLV